MGAENPSLQLLRFTTSLRLNRTVACGGKWRADEHATRQPCEGSGRPLYEYLMYQPAANNHGSYFSTLNQTQTFPCLCSRATAIPLPSDSPYTYHFENFSNSTSKQALAFSIMNAELQVSRALGSLRPCRRAIGGLLGDCFDLGRSI